MNADAITGSPPKKLKAHGRSIVGEAKATWVPEAGGRATVPDTHPP